MSKRFTKIICAIAASIFVFGVVAVAGCSNYYGSSPLVGDYSGEVKSNGGFAVEKGNYVYYINGIGSNTADNEYGTPVKGAIYRVAKNDLKNRNYSTVDKVVGNIAYSSNYDGGIFIYGDRIYYGTPSTAKNSEGVVLNDNLELKSCKLDGTEAMKDYYVQFPSAGYQYRFVEENGTVYLLYVATEEKLYEESTGVTNLHSYNTSTGTDTLLAYNVGSVTFDQENKENPRVYYTMNVYNYTGTSNTAYGYNQIYTVTASATEDKFAGKLNADTVEGWNDDEDKGAVDRYINCGNLVLDGIGKVDWLGNESSKTPFNYAPETAEINELSYSYAIKQYVGGHLFYTRKTSNNSSEYLFSLKDTAEIKPIANNIEGVEATILTDGSNAGGYKFLFKGGEIDSVLFTEDSKISINRAYTENGYVKLNTKKSIADDSKYFDVVRKNASAILGVEGDYLYYSVSGGNGHSINRINYTGSVSDYYVFETEELAEYRGVKILDLDASSSWYKPEIIDGYLLFASTTTNMTSYNYIMVFDLHKDGGEAVMNNADIRALNKQYEGISEIIEEEYGDKDKYPADKYANLQSALRYAMYDGDYEYLKNLAQTLNKDLEEDADEIYSEATFKEYDSFLTPTADSVWKDYTATKKINGKDVYANRREYYYSVLGEMSESDKEAYEVTLRSAYLVAEPSEEETAWYDGLSTVEKVFFIIGMCLIGIVVIGGGVVLTLYLLRRRKTRPEERKRRIKVDTTDDRNIDVYDYEGKEE